MRGVRRHPLSSSSNQHPPKSPGEGIGHPNEKTRSVHTILLDPPPLLSPAFFFTPEPSRPVQIPDHPPTYRPFLAPGGNGTTTPCPTPATLSHTLLPTLWGILRPFSR